MGCHNASVSVGTVDATAITMLTSIRPNLRR